MIPFILKSLAAKFIELTKNSVGQRMYTLMPSNCVVRIKRFFTDGAYGFGSCLQRVYSSERSKDNIYYTAAGASTSAIGVNIDRQSYKFSAKKTDAEKDEMLLNKDFSNQSTSQVGRLINLNE